MTVQITDIDISIYGNNGPKVAWKGKKQGDPWITYAENILKEIGEEPQGKIEISTDLPLGKGMGSSTALVIALSKALLGPDCRKEALAVEDKMNSGHSGLDFAVIWEEKAVIFKKGTKSEPFKLPEDLLKNARLIDTGAPNETTSELVAWIKDNAPFQGAIREAIETIGECTERLMRGEDLRTVMRDHHRAQVALGVVPRATQDIIAAIEKEGGSAKVLGAGGRSGGGGMVLVIDS